MRVAQFLHTRTNGDGPDDCSEAQRGVRYAEVVVSLATVERAFPTLRHRRSTCTNVTKPQRHAPSLRRHGPQGAGGAAASSTRCRTCCRTTRISCDGGRSRSLCRIRCSRRLCRAWTWSSPWSSPWSRSSGWSTRTRPRPCALVTHRITSSNHPRRQRGELGAASWHVQASATHDAHTPGLPSYVRALRCCISAVSSVSACTQFLHVVGTCQHVAKLVSPRCLRRPPLHG